MFGNDSCRWPGKSSGCLDQEYCKTSRAFWRQIQYRIIDFPLSNCANSGIDKVGVLTQYRPLELHTYLGTGNAWDLDKSTGGVFILPPYARDKGADWYKGTADAIYQNLNFIDMMDPEYVLILSGDHIYTMDYSKMLDVHRANKADATIGVFEVPWDEAPRFGIMNTDSVDGRIIEFEEKPAKPKSNLASMGIYIFNREFLSRYLTADAADENSSHDFGKNIIPAMLNDNARLYSYAFEGYWKDVGTIESLWQANMDLLADEPPFSFNSSWTIYSSNPSLPPHYIGNEAKVHNSMLNEGSMIFGEVDHSVLFSGVKIGKGAKVTNSVIMPFTKVEENAVIDHAIVAQNCVISAGAVVTGEEGAIAVVPEGEVVEAIEEGEQVS